MVQRGLTRGIAFFVACILLSLVFLPMSSSQAQDGGRLSLAERRAAERNAERGQPTDIWAVIVQPGTDGTALAASLGFEYVGQIDILPNTYLFRSAGSAASRGAQRQAADALSAAPQVLFFEQQSLIARAKRGTPDPSEPLVFTDPYYADQWHLDNRGQNGAVPGNDVLVQPVWDLGFNGSGVQIAVVDDGLEYVHPDISPNYNPVGSYDFNLGNADPAPNTPFDSHGTAVAGVAAARDETACGVGAAFRASLSGIQVLSGPTTDALEAQALGYALNVNHISSNSWGPTDSGSIFGGVGPLALAAIEQGALTGRGGRGTVYVWAGGNGLQNFDYANADAFVSSRYTIGVAATDYTGRQSWYSESGAALLVNAPSSGDGTTDLTGSELGITTSDLIGAAGYNGYPANLECTNGFGGTSSAAPLVSGIVALMLDANPTLTWRDVQHILVETAIRNDPTDPGWALNGARYPINHKYGFGRVNAFAAVNLAQNWFNVSPEASFASPVIVVNGTIPPPPSAGITSSVNVGVNNASFRVEHVVVRLNAVDLYRGDLEITLTSPSGTQSVLLAPRPFDGGTAIVNYDLMSTRHWGENPNGTWTIRIRDVFDDGFNGTFVNWQLWLYGNTGSNTQQVMFVNQPGLTQVNGVINPATGVRVGLFDRHGVPLDFDNVPVTISISSGSGALLGTLTRMTVDGVATFNDLRVNAPGHVILRAVSTGYDPDYSDPFRVYDALDRLVFLSQPTDAPANSSIAPPGGVRVAVVDSAGVPVPIDGVPVTMALANNPTGATLSGALTANTVSGVATFNNLKVNRAGTGYTLSATSPSLTSAVSAPFNISPLNMIRNGEFNDGMMYWNVFDAITWQITSGVFEFYRNPVGDSAVVFQDTGIPTNMDETLYVQLDLGNSSAVRKRVSVLVHNPDFSDLQICSFWLPPSAPMATYRMYMGTKRNWSSTVLSIYGNPNDGIGWIRVDNVIMYNMPGPGLTETLCADPRVPTPPGGTDSANLVSNGTFTGTLSPWSTFGAIVTRLEANVAEMYRSFGTPAGSLLQNTSASAPAGMPMEIRLDLGNSSSIRQRVTVLIHATNFSDLQVCVFWLEPGTPLQTHVIRTYSTAPWAGVSISVYPSPPTTLGWIRMDNVSVVTRPSMSVIGVECYMPGSTVFPSVPPAEAEVHIEAPPVFIPMPDALPEMPIIVPYAPESEPESSAEGSITE